MTDSIHIMKVFVSIEASSWRYAQLLMAMLNQLINAAHLSWPGFPAGMIQGHNHELAGLPSWNDTWTIDHFNNIFMRLNSNQRGPTARLKTHN